MILANFLDSVIPGFKVSDVNLNQEDQTIQIELIKTLSECLCYRCGQDISDALSCGKHRLKIRTMPIFGHETFLYLWRLKNIALSVKKLAPNISRFCRKNLPTWQKTLVTGWASFASFPLYPDLLRPLELIL